VGSVKLGAIHVLLRRPPDSPPSLKEVSTVSPSASLVWDPDQVSSPPAEKAEVAALILEQTSETLAAWPPNKAGSRAEQGLDLVPDLPAAAASLRFAGSGSLYPSVDAGAIGFPGCEVEAAVHMEPEGTSGPVALGRVVRLPQIQQFTVTSQPPESGSCIGILSGRDLDIVASAGRNPEHGLPVDAIPTPVPGKPGEETLRIAVPWPAPPHAPLYIWVSRRADRPEDGPDRVTGEPEDRSRETGAGMVECTFVVLTSVS